MKRKVLHSDVPEVPDVPLSPRRKVLVITGDAIGGKMAGPAIRAWNMALFLSEHHDVQLVTLSKLEQREAPFPLAYVRPGDDRRFEILESWADVIVFQGHALDAFKRMRSTEKIIVADIYDPMQLEQLEQARDLPALTWDKRVADATRTLNDQMLRADFMLCASDRQRMFYLGQLSALGRVNPANYANDPELSRLLAVVPFGFDDAPPFHERQVLKGVMPGVDETAKVILWGGGLYSWFDPKTLIRAVAMVAVDHPNVRLFFQGTKHPNPAVPEMAVVGHSRALAEELGVLGVSVFFNESWVNYTDRQNYLLEADAGVSTHFEHVETTFSFRTRILDYLWAGLPMVVTAGDSFAELIEVEQLGVVVPENDVEALAAALIVVLFDEDFIAQSRANVARVRERFRWSATLAPLVAFIASPRRAPDLVESRLTVGLVSHHEASRQKWSHEFRRDLELVTFYLKTEGIGTVLRKSFARITNR